MLNLLISLIKKFKLIKYQKYLLKLILIKIICLHLKIYHKLSDKQIKKFLKNSLI